MWHPIGRPGRTRRSRHQQEAVVGAGSADTVYSRVYDVAAAPGWPREFGGRSLRNRHTDRWAGREDELDADTIAEIRDDHVSGARSVVYAGQSAALVRGRRSATEIVAEIGAGAEALLGRWSD